MWPTKARHHPYTYSWSVFVWWIYTAYILSWQTAVANCCQLFETVANCCQLLLAVASCLPTVAICCQLFANCCHLFANCYPGGSMRHVKSYIYIYIYACLFSSQTGKLKCVLTLVNKFSPQTDWIFYFRTTRTIGSFFTIKDKVSMFLRSHVVANSVTLEAPRSNYLCVLQSM